MLHLEKVTLIFSVFLHMIDKTLIRNQKEHQSILGLN